MPFDFDEMTRGDGTREVGLPDAPNDAPLWITVASRAGVITLPLPSQGQVTIGRAPECEVRIDEPSMSRRHAVLHVGATIEVEDLGSRNGTRVGTETLRAGAKKALAIGDMVTLGGTVLVVQGAPTERPRRILSHGYFEMYLEGECARAAAGGQPFAVARVRVGDASPEVVEHLLAVVLAPIDQFAAYAPGEYEILMLQVTETLAQQRVAHLQAQLVSLGHDVLVGLAVYPTHGRTPEEISSAAAPVDPAHPREAGAAQHPLTSIERLQPLVRRIAAGDINVLILGETGAGKEVMADTIHRLSPRAKNPMLSLNCAALSETLLDSELFGYERGAFTGAVAAKQGLLETASGGSVFLDEIGEMPLPIQAKLLRVIEAKQVLRLGALKTRPIDVRFIAATHRDLEEEVARGRFRQDLFFRMNGISLVVPPLRERLDEIPALAVAFIERSSKTMGLRTPPRIAPQTLEMLRSYSWPGNIRELRNIMERAVLLSSNGIITPADIPSEKMGRTLTARVASSTSIPRISDDPPRPRHPTLPPQGIPSLGRILPTGEVPSLPPKAFKIDDTAALSLHSPDDLPVGDIDDERRRIQDALEECAGNQTAAAKLLGISRRTLVYRLTEYNMPRPRTKK